MKRNHLVLTLLGSGLAAISGAQLTPPPLPVSQNSVAQCNSHVGPYTKKKIEDPHQIVYGPQAGWTIVSYNVVDLGEYGNTTENWTSQPAGTYVSSTDFTTAFNSAFNLVASANASGSFGTLSASGASDINAALTNAYNLYSAYHNSIASSYGNITLQTNAHGNGVAVSTGSACALRLDVVLLQIDPCMMSGTQFKSYITTWTTNAIAAARRRPWDLQHLNATLCGNVATQLVHISSHSFDGTVSSEVARLASEVAKTNNWQPATPSKRLALSSNEGATAGRGGPQNVVGLGRFHPPLKAAWLSTDEVKAKIKSDLEKLAREGE